VDRFLVIGGSSAYLLRKESFGKVIKTFKLETPFGLTSSFYLIRHPEGFNFYFLSRHGEKDYDITAPFVNYRANIYGAKELGVKRIVSWTGPGSLKFQYRPGDFVVPEDLLDFTKGRKDTFFDNKGLGFVRQFPVFCPTVSEALKRALRELSLPFHEGGVYVCTQGPRLETPAEIRAFKTLGADMVGMTLSPEVFLAKELEMCYGALCYITNYAEGVKEAEFRAGELFEGMLSEGEKERVEKAVKSFPEVILKTLSILNRSPEVCSCSLLMERYRRKGKIGMDWRERVLRL